jgi:hypothetical protein
MGIERHSGDDMEIYGGPGPVRAVLIPRPGGDEACPLKVDGCCPAECRVCTDFAEEMHHRGTEGTEQ